MAVSHASSFIQYRVNVAFFEIFLLFLIETKTDLSMAIFRFA